MNVSSHLLFFSVYYALSSSPKLIKTGSSHLPCLHRYAETKRRNRVLKYVPGAVGETDVPDTLPEFISQRRRWLNGSFFAATYAIAHGGQILRSGHSAGRKFSLMCETLYNIINLIASWFAIVSSPFRICITYSLTCLIVGQLLSVLCEFSSAIDL